MREKKPISLGLYGGKPVSLDWIFPLLPECHHYVEPFSGSASILLNRKPAEIETINDIDGSLVNFFRVLRDSPDELVRQISMTPISRSEYLQAIEADRADDGDLTALEKARRFYVRARQARGGLSQNGRQSQWTNHVPVSSCRMSDVVARWQTGCTELEEIAIRLLSVQMDNRPAVEVLGLYDHGDTLFYCDPPRFQETGKGRCAHASGMTESDHEAFLEAVNDISGLVAISGYASDLYMDCLSDWMMHVEPESHSNERKREERKEILWTNYDPEEFNRQYSLFMQ